MKKVTRKSLDELANTMPRISEMNQCSFVGGGCGTKENPYTQQEFDVLCDSGAWTGGYVEEWGYTGPQTVIVGSGNNSGSLGIISGDFPDWDTGNWGDSSWGHWENGVWIIDLNNNQENNGNTNTGGGGSSSSSAGHGATATDTFLDDLTKLLKNSLSSAITGTAEIAFNIYEKVSNFMQQHPESISAVKEFVYNTEKNIHTETDPNKMGWGDLFNIWLFEQEPSNLNKNQQGKTVLAFDENAQTTKDLQTQEGVQQARDKVMAQIKSGNLNEMKHVWTYGEKEFMDGVQGMNMATSFLGSYIVTTNIVDNHDGTYSLSYTVKNDTGWASATRLRVNHDSNDNIHDSIISDCERGEGIGLGGTIEEVWEWTETIKIN